MSLAVVGVSGEGGGEESRVILSSLLSGSMAGRAIAGSGELGSLKYRVEVPS